MDFLEEIIEEIQDFFEDFFEHLGKKPTKKPVEREIISHGVIMKVRPAYIFAERIDNLLRIFFGAAIIVSAVSATFLGFQTLSGLLEILINTLWGRFIMFMIGMSYFIIAAWKLLHLNSKS